MDITQNLFWFFRGPKIADGRHVWQIENNMTKALVLLLKNTNHDVFLRAFLQDLGVPYRSGEKVNFALQRRPLLPDVTKRVVLCIAGGDPEFWDSKDRDREGRPDALIWTERWAVLVEAKLGSAVDESQIRGHLRKFGWPTHTKRADRQWQVLHCLLKQAGEKADLRPQDRFLLREWLQYMEDQGMSEFNGWTAEDFQYFDLPEARQDEERWRLQERFKRFRDAVVDAKIARRIARNYGKVGEWKTGPLWFNIGGDDSTSDWHITVYLDQGGLLTHVIVNSRPKNWRLVKDTALLRKVLIKAWQRSRQVCPVGVTVEKVRWRKGRAYGGQSPDSYEQVTEVDLGITPKAALPATADYLRALLYELCPSRGGRSEFRLECRTPREELLQLEFADQCRAVWDALRALNPLLHLLRQA